MAVGPFGIDRVIIPFVGGQFNTFTTVNAKLGIVCFQTDGFAVRATI